MSLFDFFFKKVEDDDDKKKARVVTVAVDPSQIASDKKAEDLVKLEAFAKKISESNIGGSLAADAATKPKTQEEESLEVKNPFTGI